MYHASVADGSRRCSEVAGAGGFCRASARGGADRKTCLGRGEKTPPDERKAGPAEGKRTGILFYSSDCSHREVEI